MPCPEIPADQVSTFRPVTSLQDLETYSEFYFCFRAAGHYSKVPAPKIGRSWITGDPLLLLVIPLRRGWPPVRIPLTALGDLRITDERFKPFPGPAIPLGELDPVEGPVDV